MGWKESLKQAFRRRPKTGSAAASPAASTTPAASPPAVDDSAVDASRGADPAAASSADDASGSDDARRGMSLADLLASVAPPRASAGGGLTTGGGERSDGGAAFGYALARGRRATMEDFHAAEFRTHPDLPTPVGAFGIFDGHGGPSAARFAARRLLDTALAHPRVAADPAAALTAAFEAVDAAYVAHGGDGSVRLDGKKVPPPPPPPAAADGEAPSSPRTPPRGARAPPPPRDDGCTAVAALVLASDVVVAHAGDSRAVLVVPGDGGGDGGSESEDEAAADGGDGAAPPPPPRAAATALSRDHKPDRPDERARIEAAGGAVVWAGAWRVGGVLAVSRAIGDAALKPFGVTATPDVGRVAIPAAKDGAPPPLLILASDGVWDVLTNGGAARVAARAAGAAGDARAAAAALAKEALARRTADNVSVIVVRLGAAPEGGGAAAEG